MWIGLRPEEIYSRNELYEVKNNMLASAENIFILHVQHPWLQISLEQKILENTLSSSH